MPASHGHRIDAAGSPSLHPSMSETSMFLFSGHGTECQEASQTRPETCLLENQLSDCILTRCEKGP